MLWLTSDWFKLIYWWKSIRSNRSIDVPCPSVWQTFYLLLQSIYVQMFGYVWSLSNEHNILQAYLKWNFWSSLLSKVLTEQESFELESIKSHIMLLNVYKKKKKAKGKNWDMRKVDCLQSAQRKLGILVLRLFKLDPAFEPASHPPTMFLSEGEEIWAMPERKHLFL